MPAMIMWNTKKNKNGFRGRSEKYKSKVRAVRSRSDLPKNVPLHVAFARGRIALA